MNASQSMPHALRAVLEEALVADDALVVLTEGDTPATAGLPDDRIWALPIADRAAAAVALGLAWGGRRVLVELAATGRLPALAEALTAAAATPSSVPVPIVWRVPFGAEAGPLDGAALDVLSSVPGLSVVCPRDPDSGARLLAAALKAARPTVFLEPRALARAVGPVDAHPATWSAAERVRDGDDVLVVTFGAGVGAALEAAEAKAADDVHVAVVDLVALAPLDVGALGRQARDVGRIVVAAPPAEVALADRVVRAVLGAAFEYLESPPAVCDATPEAIAHAVDRAVAW